jgi:arylsulfatase A-like enzyme
MITGIDNAIARVLKALEEAGLADNTIVIYSADNGYYLGDRGFQGKWSHFEESLRVPMIIHDPRVPKEQRGRVIAAMALNMDLPATFLDWAGVKAPATYRGRSLAPLVTGHKPADWRHEFFCEHVDLAPTLTWEGIRGERYVYARYFDQQPPFEFLHDLKADPAQLKNFAADPAAAKTLAEMRAKCDAAIKDFGGPVLPLAQRHAALPKAAPKNKAKKQ